MTISSHTSKAKRTLRVRSKLMGTTARPRLSVYRSGKHLQAQLIDDEKHVTIFGLSTVNNKTTGTKTDQATLLGTALAEAATKKGIKAVVFDRGPARFHGRIKAVATAARSGGLEF